MYKLIVCDLDETLLNDCHTISQRDITAIQKALASGVKFVPATGRGYNCVGNILKEIGLENKAGEYVISYNGGAVTENQGIKLLYFKGISFELAQELYHRGLQYNVCIQIFTKNMVYVYRASQGELAYLTGRMEFEEIFEENIDFLKNQDIVKMLYGNTDYFYLKRIEHNLKDLDLEIDISYSSNRYIEFNCKGVNKGSGLIFLANFLGIKLEETIAIGDNFNDLPMIHTAGLGVGVYNTIEEMKSLCDYITSATNNDSAVAEVIEKFVLVDE